MYTVVIPARYASQRLPGKALLPVAGVPMIRRVYERAVQSNAARVVVATDDERIIDVVRSFGGEAIMTAVRHPTGTDRIQEATTILGLAPGDIVVNVQGDEPLIPPEVIDQVARNLAAAGPSVEMATLWEPIATQADLNDPNIVKLVTDNDDLALYFSRAPIPFDRDATTPIEALAAKRHVGIYGYRVSLLNRFVHWSPVHLETVEKLEQLRALVHGVRIHAARAQISIPPGIDTEADLKRTERVLESAS